MFLNDETNDVIASFKQFESKDPINEFEKSYVGKKTTEPKRKASIDAAFVPVVIKFCEEGLTWRYSQDRPD